jgi:predicted glycosyltransferase
VPYTAQGETEQADRAMRLARIGRVAVLSETDISGAALVAAIRKALAQPLSPDTLSVAVNGAARSAQMLKQLVTRSREGTF